MSGRTVDLDVTQLLGYRICVAEAPGAASRSRGEKGKIGGKVGVKGPGAQG